MPREIDERKKRKALRKLRKAADLAARGEGPELSDWEKEFLEEVEEEIAELRTNPAPETLEAKLHFLKGSALNLGFDDFSITIITPPTVTAHPVDVNATAGTSATFTVDANGTGLTYQWQRNGIDIPGANASTLTLRNQATIGMT